VAADIVPLLVSRLQLTLQVRIVFYFQISLKNSKSFHCRDKDNIHVVIDELSRIVFHNEKFYIMERANNALMVYSKEGIYEKSIGKIGNGHGEYVMMSDFAIDNDSIYILDAGKHKINIYDITGDYIHSLDYEENVYEYTIDHGYLWFYNSPPASMSKYHFTSIDSDNHKKQHIERKVTSKLKNLCGGTSVFAKAKDITFASPRFENEIYAIKENSMISMLSIDFGKYTCPKEALAQKCGIELSSKYAIRTSLFASENYLVIGYNYKDAVEKYCFIERSDNKIKYGIPKNDFFNAKEDHPFHFFPLWGNDGYLIQKMEPIEIIKFCPSLVKFNQRLRSMSEDSAPVLLLYKLKD